MDSPGLKAEIGSRKSEKQAFCAHFAPISDFRLRTSDLKWLYVQSPVSVIKQQGRAVKRRNRAPENGLMYPLPQFSFMDFLGGVLNP
ncbi:MAG: hypothetical protein KDD10_22250, partial [Phaeodactylibacter sp.]|nr:hypothetical protein [Phaeodactylibacter sp.]